MNNVLMLCKRGRNKIIITIIAPNIITVNGRSVCCFVILTTIFVIVFGSDLDVEIRRR